MAIPRENTLRLKKAVRQPVARTIRSVELVEDVTVTPASHVHEETDITDGALLARLAAAEVITGLWRVAGITGEFIPQSGNGVPAHVASLGTLYVNLADANFYVNSDGDTTWLKIGPGGAGAHGKASHTEFANWKLRYTDDNGDEQEIALGAAGTFLRSAGAAAAPTCSAIEDGDVPASHAGSEHHTADHKDRHDPNDGADPLDTAAPNDIFPDDVNAEGTAHSLALSDHTHGIDCDTPLAISGVQAGAEGADYNFARALHVHAIAHSILDNALVTVDDVGGGVVDEYAQWTADGLRSRSAAQVLSDIGAGITAAELTDLSDGGETALHSHAGGGGGGIDGLNVWWIDGIMGV